MPKLRLTIAMRDKLKEFAGDLVRCPAEKEALDAAYKKAAPLVRASVLAIYPTRDMRVLLKYYKARIDDCIKLKLTAGGVDTFNFEKGTGPVVATMTYQGTIYAADDKTTDAFAEWQKASDTFATARKKKIADYSALVNASRTFEDVTEIWPEAAKLRPKMKSTALIVLTPDIVARIKSDVASRAKK